MSIWDTVKKTYNKVDKKLGGYLPGGQTPSQVRTERATPAPTPAPVSQPRSIPTYGSSSNSYGSMGPSGWQPNQNSNPQSIDRAAEQRYNNSSSGTTRRSSGSSNNNAEAALANYDLQAPVNTLTAATPQESRAMTPAGQFLAGAKAGFGFQPDAAGREQTAIEGPEGAGVLAGQVAGIAALGTGGEFVAGKVAQYVSQMSSYLKGATAARTSLQVLSAADKAGMAITKGKDLVKVGDTVADAGLLIKNTKQAERVGNLMIESAQKISPNNWKRVLGFFKNNMGKVTAVAGASLLSEMTSINYLGDNIDRLGFAADAVAKSGNMEGAQELYDLQEDAIKLAGDAKSYIPFYQVPVAFTAFTRDQLRSNELKRESLAKEAEKNAVVSSFEQRLASGTVTREEKMAFAEAFPDEYLSSQILSDIADEDKYAAIDAARTEADRLKEEANVAKFAQIDQDKIDNQNIEYDVDTQRLSGGQILAERILASQMTAEQIINDPEIRAFALDPNNQFSAITKLYTEAITATGRGNFYGDDGTTGETVPASTLGFGLLSTGGAKKNAQTSEPDIQAENLTTVAENIYGIPYDQLTPAQKAIVDKQEEI